MFFKMKSTHGKGVAVSRVGRLFSPLVVFAEELRCIRMNRTPNLKNSLPFVFVVMHQLSLAKFSQIVNQNCHHSGK